MPPHLIKYFEKKTPVIDSPSALIRHRSAALRRPGCGCAAGPRAAPSESLLNIHREASSPRGSSKFTSLGSLGAFCALLHRFPPAPRAALGAPAPRSGPERFCFRTAPHCRTGGGLGWGSAWFPRGMPAPPAAPPPAPLYALSLVFSVFPNNARGFRSPGCSSL